MAAYFFRSVFLLVLLNLIVKPLWIFGIDREVQTWVGYKAYGTYFAYFSLTLIFNIIADAGITLYIQRNIANLQTRGIWFNKAVRYKMGLSVIYLLLVLCIGALLDFTNLSLLFSLAILQILLSWISFCRAVLSAEQAYDKSSFLSILDKLLIIIPLGWLLYMARQRSFITVETFAWWQVASSAAALLWGVFYIMRQPQVESSSQTMLSYKEIIRQSFPYALMVFFMFLHSRADGILLEKLSGNQTEETGLYAALYRFIDAGTVFSYLISGFFLSYWSKHLHHSPIIYDSLSKMFSILISVALWIGIYFFYFSDVLTKLIYHSSDIRLVYIMKWGFLTFIPCFIVDVFGTLLTAHQRIKAMLSFVMLSTVINIGLNIFMIPAYGAQGAMYVAMLTQGFFGICLWIYCKKHWQVEPKRILIVRLIILAVVLCVSAHLLKMLIIHPLLQGIFLLIIWLLSILFLKLFSVNWFKEIQSS